MTKTKLLGVLGVIAALAAGCGEDESAGDARAMVDGGPPPGSEVPAFGGEEDMTRAAALWSEIDGYESWESFPGLEGLQEGNSPHGAYVSFYLNDVAAGDPNGLPDGSIIIKNNYADEAGEMLGAVTVMKRVAGFAPEDGDWYWVKYSATGDVDTNEAGVGLAGRVAGCISCHNGADGADMVFVNGGTAEE